MPIALDGFARSPLKRRATSTIDSNSIISHREVAHELKLSRTRHRQRGQVPYPLQLNDRDVLDFSTWDHLFFTRIYNRSTLQEYTVPPKRVLDLGCGNGFWTMMAAERWKGSTFVGFDISTLQPNLYILANGDLASRISWVQGNFLEKLPFSDEEFDFVVIHCIGLGVPEDEWQDIIEEICRILKPDGILEIMEEDIIFPCPDPPPDRAEESIISSIRTPSESSTLSFNLNFNPNDAKSLKQRSFSSSLNSAYSIAPILTPVPSSPQYEDDMSDRQLSYNEAQFRRDHSVLHESFQHMLSARFINPKILVVLPFYLQAAFSEVQNYPKVNIYLPPPSASTANESMTHRRSTESNSLVDLTPVTPMVQWPSNNTSNYTHDSQNNFNTTNNTSNAPSLASVATAQSARMHLARTIRLFIACKENLWIEYEKLHRHERRMPNAGLDREEFDTYFWNWQCDMEDRAGMRSMLKSQLSWGEPLGVNNNNKPDWQIWRDKDAEYGFDPSTLNSEPCEKNLCRSFRGFVCRKPLLKTPSPLGGSFGKAVHGANAASSGAESSTNIQNRIQNSSLTSSSYQLEVPMIL